MASPLTPRLPRRAPWISELRRPRPDVHRLETRLLPARLLIALAILVLAASRAHRARDLVVAGAVCAAYLAAYALLHRPAAGAAPVWPGWLATVGLDVAAVTVLIPVTGGSQSPVALLYVLPAAVAGMALGLRPALLVVTAEVVAYVLASGPAAVLVRAPRDSGALILTLYLVGGLTAWVARAQAAAGARVAALSRAVAETARTVDRAADLGSSLAIVGATLRRLTGASMVAVLHRAEGGAATERRSDVAWSQGLVPGYLEALEAGGLALGRLGTTGAGLRVSRDDPAWTHPAGLRAAIAGAGLAELRLLPVSIGGRVVGRVDLGFQAAATDVDAAIAVAEPLLHHAGVAIARERAARQADRRQAALVSLQEGLLEVATEGSATALLRRAAALSRDLTQARHAAIAIWDERGALLHFETAGVDPALRRALGPGPHGQGLLGRVARAAAPVRMARAATHPAATALPPGHPPVTSLLGVPIPHLGTWTGAFYVTGKRGAAEFSDVDEATGQMIAAHVAAVLHLHRVVTLERDTHDGLLRMLVELSDAHEHATHAHSERVNRYARRLGEAIGLAGPELEAVGRAALLHDIGKLGVPDSLLQKPGALTADERMLVMTHAALGAEIVTGVDALASLGPAIRHHHERWDGAGYPDGLGTEAIPLAARIVAVADALDTITTDRPYRGARPMTAALAELRRCAGTHFDPQVVTAALAVFEPLASGCAVPASPGGPGRGPAPR